MYVNGDLLGDEGRKALDACVKVKIYGRPENLPKNHWMTALEKLDKCYAGCLPRPDWMYPLPTNPWLLNDRLHHLMLPTEWDEEGNPDKEKIFDIIKIHDALIKFDEMPYVESYPKPGRGSDELKELIDKRRADVERECQEATANPDARIQYSWLVAQRRVRDCFAGSFAGDSLLVQLKRDPNEPYNIVDIHDAVVHWNEKSFFQFKCSACAVYFARSEAERCYLEPRNVFYPEDKFWWKKHTAERDDVEREFKEATSTTDKVIKEYSRDEAELRVRNCYGYGDCSSFKFYVLDGTPILPIKRDDSGKVDQTYNISDIHKALQQLDEKKLLQKYPDEGPGSAELTKSIEENNLRVKQEYEKATSELSRYSHSEAEKRVRDCFEYALPKEKVKFSTEEDETKEPCSNRTYDIFDIHKMLSYVDETERNATIKMLKRTDPSDMTESEKAAKEKRDAVIKEYKQAKSGLQEYSWNEAEHRVRDCFAGTILRRPGDTDIFPTKEEESGVPKTQQTYDIFEIKKAIDYFDKKKLRDKYLDEKDQESKRKNRLADEQRAKIKREYAEATKKVEIEHGSGFIIHDHFIVTNKHVIVDVANDKNKKISISNAAIGKLNSYCEVIEDDGLKDLALLYCKDLNLKQNGVCPLQLSDQPLLPGMQIFSFGYPMSHTDERALFVNGHVSGSKKTYSGHTIIVLNCSLNSGNSGGPILCWVSGQLKVVGVATQKHFKEILTLEERAKIEKIRESLQTSTIPSVPDDAIKCASVERASREHAICYHPGPDPCQTPMFLLTLKLYDALESHSQFNLSNALPGQYVIEFIKETIRRNKGESKQELEEVVKWSEDRLNILPSGHCSTSKCCVQ